ncbi:MAG TPA: hypothetical protein VLE69_01445 [Candidatus Saccharimonadales bacterium]|nr:hypothetical protein [Candidatus Saccharimonadales bacterium]
MESNPQLPPEASEPDVFYTVRFEFEDSPEYWAIMDDRKNGNELYVLLHGLKFGSTHNDHRHESDRIVPILRFTSWGNSIELIPELVFERATTCLVSFLLQHGLESVTFTHSELRTSSMGKKEDTDEKIDIMTIEANVIAQQMRQFINLEPLDFS